MMLSIDNCVLVIVDVQGKLAQLMYDKEKLFANLVRMVKGAKILGIPVLWNEQNPVGLGPTIPELAELLTDQAPLAKSSFSCCGNQNFAEQLQRLGRRQVLLVGIETHVCVYQTAVDLIAKDYDVQVVADAVSSRTLANKQIGLERMRGYGATITSAETALFELLRVADGPKFKEISRLVK
jgi:nicotinamidase-related amidase